MPSWKKLISSGSSAVLSSLTLDSPLAVAQGGTGAATLTSGYALLGNGTSAPQMINSTADSTLLVGNGSTMVAESGATLRTSIGVGTGDTPIFAGVEGGEINIGITGDNEIDTDSGNLTIDSAGGTVTVDDHLTVTGTLTESSTLEIKKNVTQLDDGLDKILLMRGVEFDYKENNLHSIGVIAEELSEVEPYLLSFSSPFRISGINNNSPKGVINNKLHHPLIFLS